MIETLIILNQSERLIRQVDIAQSKHFILAINNLCRPHAKNAKPTSYTVYAYYLPTGQFPYQCDKRLKLQFCG